MEKLFLGLHSRQIKLIAAILCLFSSLSMSYAQSITCDTTPTCTFWQGTSRIFERRPPNNLPTGRILGLGNTGLDFAAASANGDPALLLTEPWYGGSSAEVAAFATGPDGRPRFLFDGQYLYDGATRLPLAGGEALGDYSNFNDGASYIQPLLLIDPHTCPKRFNIA